MTRPRDAHIEEASLLFRIGGRPAAYVASLGPGPGIPEEKYTKVLEPGTAENNAAIAEGGEIFRVNCAMCHTDVCDDCVVTFVVNRNPGKALVIDVAEERAVRLLARAGLVPELRHASSA